MTAHDARLLRNLSSAFGSMSIFQLYYVALTLRRTLAERELDCRPEADALVAALLADARIAHARLHAPDDA